MFFLTSIMTLNIIPPDFFLPHRSVKLGRLVKFVEYPTYCYHDPLYTQSLQATPIVHSEHMRVSQGESSTDFSAKLISLLSSSFPKRANESVRIHKNFGENSYAGQFRSLVHQCYKLRRNKKGD